jgi:hypothetical protein
MKFLNILIGGDIAPIGYVLGFLFSVMGAILFYNVEEFLHYFGASTLCIVGAIILFFRVRKDVIAIKNDME